MRAWLDILSPRLADKNRYFRCEGPEKRRTPDPEVLAPIRSEGQRLGITQPEIGDEEIVERCMLARANEGG